VCYYTQEQSPEVETGVGHASLAERRHGSKLETTMHPVLLKFKVFNTKHYLMGKTSNYSHLKCKMVVWRSVLKRKHCLTLKSLNTKFDWQIDPAKVE